MPEQLVTISQWREAQLSNDKAIDNIVRLVASLDPNDPAWITISSEKFIRSQWEDLQKLIKSFGDGNVGSNAPGPFKEFPLYGVPFAVKDNIDVAGLPTTAACPAYQYLPKQDAVIISLLRQAGAIVVGKTNLDQFATGLVGTRSPYGRPSSVYSSSHVPGGSSSGSAVVVGKGLVPFSLGTDTAGSGRVPAMLNNIVGLKPTLGVFSATGVVPACKSLDCVSIFARSVSDAQAVFNIAAQYDSSYGYSRAMPSSQELTTTFFKKGQESKPKFAIPSNPRWYGEVENPKLFRQAIDKLKTIVDIEEVDFTLLYDLANLLYEGPWVAERYAAVRDIITRCPEEMNPVVRGIIAKAENFSAADFFDYEYKRKDMLQSIDIAFGSYAGIIVPTAPLNPTFAQVDTDPVGVNSCQGTYTNFVNLADMSGLSVPAGFRPDGLPFGITFLSKAFNDYALADLARKFLQEIRSPSLSGVMASSDSALHNMEYRTMPLCVVGSHLSGMALNWQLTSLGAELEEQTTTSNHYLLYKLNSEGGPLRPGLRRVSSGGKKIECEVWNISVERFGEFVAMVPPPLAIGSVELADGSWVKGFVCEERGYTDDKAINISSFGGWRSYVKSTVATEAVKGTVAPASGETVKTAAPLVAPFRTVLVANRGEIAVRIIKTLKKLGVESVAVYSEPDKFAAHVRDADRAVSLNGTSAHETYLSIDKIMKAAKETGAEAIIPGYGFLSENADFAMTCNSHGIVFVGPETEAIQRLGLKHSAREIAAHAAVPIVPGSGLMGSVSEAREAAQKIGFPLMIKSTAGGGGIGILRVDRLEDVEQAFMTIQHQGNQFFNDTGVFLEKFVADARHVEVQVIGDGLGGALAIGERDCSLQRRNQKIIEETPAPLLPAITRRKMLEAAERLCSSINYKNVGTVEYIYDADNDEFYFLEVNTRLQVEHPITEAVTGVDLVEWMLRVASGDVAFLSTYNKGKSTDGTAIEIRVYAECPLRGFTPSTGQITKLRFPSWARVDTWIEKGTRVSSEYDPTLAKIIVHGHSRIEAIQLALKAIDETEICGIETNLGYVRGVLATETFQAAKMTTRFLDTKFSYAPRAFEVINPGNYTTIQDYPARLGLWHIGVPPSGPMDDYAFRVANKLVGNNLKAAALECTISGPELLFHSDAILAVTGGDAPMDIDGELVAMWASHKVSAGSRVKLGKAAKGCRMYIAVCGGVDVPEYLGSRSTFVPGNMGGLHGGLLKRGDVLNIGGHHLEPPGLQTYPQDLIPSFAPHWKVAVTVGPHGCPDFFQAEYLDTFFATEWKVHYNSNRWGVRLVGPKPEWARLDGGEAGLHPSNAHDYVYSLGAVNFTGDEPVILTCDGPSLGGFVCPVVVIECELWKIGQVRPGDSITFFPVTFDRALEMKKELIKRIDGIIKQPEETWDEAVDIHQCILSSLENPFKVVLRQAGDRYVLCEFGENVMDLNMSYAIDALIASITKFEAGIVEMSRGVRSVLVEFDPTIISQPDLVASLLRLSSEISIPSDWKRKSRSIRLPLAFEDKKTLAAVERYKETIRSEAPWLPNNVDFLKEVNGLNDRGEVRDILYRAKFLVLGLGDVFLGAPCAVPLDPRHRLLGTKYNPSRSYTPNGTVGIGGMYMCIYTMDSPGGYQLVGRTIPIWDKLMLNVAQKHHPWLLNPFDQIEYFPVSEAELEVLCREVEGGVYEMDIRDTVFDYGEYSRWLDQHKESIALHERKQKEGNAEMAKLLLADREVAAQVEPANPETYSPDAILAYADVTGRFWKACVSEGDKVIKGDPVVVLEAMKTEIIVIAPASGKVARIRFRNGDMVEMGDVVAIIE